LRTTSGDAAFDPSGNESGAAPVETICCMASPAPPY